MRRRSSRGTSPHAGRLWLWVVCLLLTGGRALAESESPESDTTEAPRWLDPTTGKASRALVACGLRLDFELDEDGPRDLVKVSIVNRSATAATLHADRAIVRLADGTEYRLSPLRERVVSVEAASETRATLRFPEHARIRAERRMTIVLPFETGDDGECTASTDLERPMTFWPSTVELSLGAGSRFAALGGPARLGGKNGVETVQGSIAIFWRHHGITFDVLQDYYGGSDVSGLGTGVELGKNPRVRADGYFLGYALRAPVFSWLTLNYGMSAGLYSIGLHDDSQKKARVASTFGSLRQHAGLTAVVVPGRHMQVALSPMVVHTFLPSGSFGSVSTRGSSVSWMMNLALLF
jgi:hypothetical protein